MNAFLLAKMGRMLHLVSSIDDRGHIIQDARHTHVYFFQVIVHVPLDVYVFHLYRWHYHPLPNVISIASLWKQESAQAHQRQAILLIWLVVLLSFPQELVPWK